MWEFLLKRQIMKKIVVRSFIVTASLLFCSATSLAEEIKQQPIYQDGSSYVYNLEKAILKAIDKIETLQNDNKQNSVDITQLKEQLSKNLLQTESLSKKVENMHSLKATKIQSKTGSLTKEEIEKIENFINN